MPGVYEEFVNFIVAETAPDKIIAFAPSETARARVWELVAREKNGTITTEESRELEQFAHLEHVFRVAKARAFERAALANSVSK